MSEQSPQSLEQATELEPGREKEQGVDAIQRFKVAQHEFIKAAGRLGLDSDARLSIAEARQLMSSAAEEISKDAGLMRQAESARILDQVKSLIRENRLGLSKEKGFELDR